MIKFIIIFFSIYTLIHGLVFFRIRILLLDRVWLQKGIPLFFILMIFTPILCRFCEKNEHELIARMSAFIGFHWMGFIFLSFVISFFMGMFDIFVKGINYFTRLTLPVLSGKIPVLLMMGTVLILFVYGIFEAQSLRIETLTIETHKLPQTVKCLRIVQISDLHLGLISRTSQLKRIVQKVQTLSPDILVSTGDLLDGHIGDSLKLKHIFQNIQPRHGKYAVTGNHEYYIGLKHAVNVTQELGFNILQGKTKTIPSLINIVGIDDRNSAIQELHVLSSVPKNGLFTLFLKHQPIIRLKSLGLFDLQLSGHTHGGQIFPFNFLVSLPFPYLNGYYSLEKGSSLYVNRGTGTWGPQVRILSPPEITVIELKYRPI